jgi:thiamine biosynthesis lipoprotein
MNEHRFAAMGCEVVVHGGTGDEHRAIERLFAEREATFSRFIPDSELNRVNAAAGRVVLVSPLFADTLRVALRASEESDGLVTPTLGGPLEAAGYVADSALLRPDPRPPDEPSPSGAVVVLGRAVRVDPGVKLDLNGVVKSLAVDDALELLRAGGSVSAGGDVATSDEVSVALPGGGAVALRRGALATSGTTKRWWLRGEHVQHHLIDPRTQRPAQTPWCEVTACGATCVGADIAAKAGFLRGADGPEWLAARGIPARFVTTDGEVRTNGAWDRSMREAAACI